MLGFNGRGVAMATACGKMLAERLRGSAPNDLPLPTTPLKPIAFHRLRNVALTGAIAWKGLLDRWGVRRFFYGDKIFNFVVKNEILLKTKESEDN